MKKVYDVLLKHGKITQAQYDAAKLKPDAIDIVKAEYKSKRNILTKSQMQEILDKLV